MTTADLVAAVASALQARGAMLALAESCTGGLVAKLLTDRAGSSSYMHSAIVSYANDAKVNLLGVRADTLAAHGAVSEATARAMLEGVRARTGVRAAVSITGVAGPDGGSAEKPVGTVWIGASLDDDTLVRHYRFDGDRAAIREQAARAALQQLLDVAGAH